MEENKSGELIMKSEPDDIQLFQNNYQIFSCQGNSDQLAASVQDKQLILNQNFDIEPTPPQIKIGITKNGQDMKLLLELFNKFDKLQKGMIEISDLKEVLQTIGHGYSYEALNGNIISRVCITEKGYLTFDEFLSLLSEIELQKQTSGDTEELAYKMFVEPDMRVIEFIKLLDNYRTKCERDGNYSEAKKAQLKIQEVKQKEQLRHQNNLMYQQQLEFSNIEQLQRIQYMKFTQAWDQSMVDYEAQAYTNLEKFKKQQQEELEAIAQNCREELQQGIKFSKKLLELRYKENKLVSVKKYSEAEKVKAKADQVEQEESYEKQILIEEQVEKKMAKIKQKQQQQLLAFLRRLQQYRQQQIKQRQADYTRLITKNKNLRTDLKTKHDCELKKASTLFNEQLFQKTFTNFKRSCIKPQIPLLNFKNPGQNTLLTQSKMLVNNNNNKQPDVSLYSIQLENKNKNKNARANSAYTSHRRNRILNKTVNFNEPINSTNIPQANTYKVKDNQSFI